MTGKASILACAPAVLLMLACSSTSRLAKGGTRSAPLRGMAYDFESRPVSEAEIRVDGNLPARSDINGRFLAGDLSFGRHEVEVSKRGYEPAAIAFDFEEAGQIVYAKLFSARQLLSLSEKEAEARDWAGALALLDRIDAVAARDAAAPDPAARYLRAAVLFRRGEAKEAREILETLLAEGQGGEAPDEAYVHLFLADLLQFRLGDERGAEAHLEAYLASRCDPDVEKRLLRLREEGGEP